jgi:small GTP-binding protein
MLPYDHLLKIVVAGDSAVGKSCLLSRFVDNSFAQTYTSTVGVDFKIKTMEVDGTTVKLQVWDTAGQERFKAIVNSYYRGANVVFIVFDLSTRETFINVTKWYNEAQRLSLDDTKMILIGCKSDLSWEVSLDEIKETAQRFEIPWAICSAYSGSGVNDVFQKAVRSTIDTQRKKRVSDTVKMSQMEIEEPDRPNPKLACCMIL